MGAFDFQTSQQNPKNPQRRLVYENIVKDLNEGIAISKIAKNYNITRQTIYRIKNDIEYNSNQMN